MDYVILAGGNGSRLKADGIETPKPMIKLGGEPMLGRLIKLLAQYDARKIIVAANSAVPVMFGYINRLMVEGYPVDIVPVNNDNSFLSLKSAAEKSNHRFIGVTCDAVFEETEFGLFVARFMEMSDREGLMGLTRYIHDESPLYADINNKGLIKDYRYGGEPFNGNKIISAGIYGLQRKMLEDVERKYGEPVSLNDFQQKLARDWTFKLRPYEFSAVIDVDTKHDLELAERFVYQV